MKKTAKYYALVDSDGKHILLDTRNMQLEIYEERKYIPKNLIQGRQVLPVYVSKTPPTQQINQNLVDALQGLINVQNGPPLINYKKEWEQAVQVAQSALASVKGA